MSRFRKLETGFWGVANDLEVFWAEFWLDDFRKHELAICPNSENLDLRIINPMRDRNPRYVDLVTELDSRNVSFRIGKRSEVCGDTVLVFGNGVAFYFDGPPSRRLSTISLAGNKE